MPMTTVSVPAGLTGCTSALPTPFRNGGIDEGSFSMFCEWQVAQHVSAVAVGGATGEAPTLAPSEHRRTVGLAVEAAHGFRPVVAGIVANATEAAIELAKAAEAERADALLVTTPYYNRPTQDGLYRHFRAIHDAVGLPMLLHDVPSRAVCALAVPTVVRLAELPRIVGLCDASGDLTRPARLRRELGDRLLLLGGDDATMLGFLAQGGDGCISVVSNVAPRLSVRLYDAWAGGNNLVAQAAALALGRLVDALMLESDPGPLKYALSMLDWMNAELRLPLHPPAEATRDEVRAALAGLGLLPQHGRDAAFAGTSIHAGVGA